MRDDKERLKDILEEIQLIEKYSLRGRAAFDADELIQTWMVKHLENISEACRSMSEEFRSQHPDVPWREIIAQRTYLVHIILCHRSRASLVVRIERHSTAEGDDSKNAGVMSGPARASDWLEEAAAARAP